MIIIKILAVVLFLGICYAVSFLFNGDSRKEEK